MQYRHLDYQPDAPVTQLGPAAIDALLDQGDLQTWAPLAQAIRSEPHGDLADTVLRICKGHEMYGTSSLWRRWIEHLRGAGRSEAPWSLSELRRRRGRTQQEISTLMGISQSDVSKLERRSDLRLSTLRSYVQATGGALEVRVHYPDSIEGIDIAPS